MNVLQWVVNTLPVKVLQYALNSLYYCGEGGVLGSQGGTVVELQKTRVRATVTSTTLGKRMSKKLNT